ncbi:MAG: hybrid sensor histidine kinase/response regulator [Phormidesmis sp.]
MLTTLQDTPLKILIIDDDEVDRMALKRALKGTNFTVSVSEVGNGEAALKSIEETDYSCIFLDYNLPGKNGLELARQIRQQGIKVPLLVLTGQGDEQTAVELMKAGASDYLPKSKLSAEAIARLMRSSIRMHRAEAIVEQANEDLRRNNRLLEKQNKELARQRRYIYQQNLQLQEVSRLKSEFLATMSHELRTPLNAIIGFSQILLSKAKGPLSDKQSDMLSRVLANGKNLLELINDILAFSKIEAGRLALDPTELDIIELVTRTTEELQSLATQKPLTLTVNVDMANPIVINDKVRVRQILVNLLSNAIKFTEAGSVEVRLSGRHLSERPAKESSPDRNHTKSHTKSHIHTEDTIHLLVSDTGCGISPEEQLYIFDPFHQADQRVTRKHSGTGLGLAITHSLVKMMHGSIELTSQVGKGTEFHIELPREVVLEEGTVSLQELVYSGAQETETERENKSESKNGKDTEH